MKKTGMWIAVIAAGLIASATARSDTFEAALNQEQATVKTQSTVLKDQVLQHDTEAVVFGKGGHNGGRNGGRLPGGRLPGPGKGGGWGHHGSGPWGDGHPGWGRGKGPFGYRDGRWLWGGWVLWTSARGLCDAYYAGSYRACSNAAWSNNAACAYDCASTSDPQGCDQACGFETRNAINSCEWSYRQVWNCGVPVLWPPVGVVIRIP
jgi:hypothetical protein